MAEVASAYVALIPTFRGAQDAISSELGGAVATTAKSPAVAAAGQKVGKGLAAGIGSGLKGVGGQMLGGMGLLTGLQGAAGIFSEGVTGASKLEQSLGAVDAVFKGTAEQIKRSASTAATDLGLTQNAYQELATVLGAGLKNKGIEDYAAQTQGLITVGADLAAQFGGSTQEAVDALASAMRGESDPIERYGVSLNESAINAELAARGQSKLKGAALEQAKTQARLALITRQTADAQGAFAREADTNAGKQQRVDAAWQNIVTTMGSMFLPMIDAVLSAVQPVTAWLTQNPVAVGVLAGVLGGILVVALAAVTAAVWSFTVALLANPVTWIVVGVVALIAAIVALAMNWDRVVAWISDVWGGFVGWLSGVWDAIVSGVQGFGASVSGFFTGLWDGIVATAQGAWDGLVSWVTGIPGRILSALGNVGNLLYDAGKSIIEGFWRGLRAMWDNVTGWISGIGEWIQNNKGPISYDRTLLVKNGMAIMAGFDAGLRAEDGWRSTIRDVTADITGSSLLADVRSASAQPLTAEGLIAALEARGISMLTIAERVTAEQNRAYRRA